MAAVDTSAKREMGAEPSLRAQLSPSNRRRAADASHDHSGRALDEGGRAGAAAAQPGAKKVVFKETTALRAPEMAAAISHLVLEFNSELKLARTDTGGLELREERNSTHPRNSTIPQSSSAAAQRGTLRGSQERIPRVLHADYSDERRWLQLEGPFRL